MEGIEIGKDYSRLKMKIIENRKKINEIKSGNGQRTTFRFKSGNGSISVTGLPSIVVVDVHCTAVPRTPEIPNNQCNAIFAKVRQVEEVTGTSLQICLQFQ